MKYFRVFFLLIVVSFFISSCQKELSYEAGLGKGTLKKDDTGECLPVNVNGSYITDSLLKPTINYVDIQVSVSEPGSYAIKTDSINGYSFNGAGVFAVQGLNTVRLIGSGKPIAAGSDMFTVKFDTSVCQFNVTVTGAGSGGGGGSTTAAFTLAGSPTTCTGATQSNNFYATMPASSSNYVDIKADVTTAGSYTINSASVNGVSFSASGNLSVGTNQNIRLIALGTPTAAGSFQYALSTTVPSSNCGFNLTVLAAPSAAMFSFECPSNPLFFGTYQAGVSTARDSVRINVTSVAGGSYSITTSTTTNANNVTFAGSGILSASPNPQSVTLFASGIPTASGTFNYTLSATGVTSTCTFTQTYSAAVVSTITAIIGSATTATTFNFDSKATYDSTTVSGYKFLVIGGYNTATGNEAVLVGVGKPTGTGAITPGTYTVNQGPAIGVSAIYTTATAVNYSAFSNTMPQTPAFTITITAISTGRVSGTFNGPVKDNNGAGPGVINISNGTFDVPIM